MVPQLTKLIESALREFYGKLFFNVPLMLQLIFYIHAAYKKTALLHIRNINCIYLFFQLPDSMIIRIMPSQQKIYQRTSFVPLEYHYRTTISKTSRKQRAFTYLWSTTIVPLFFILNPTPPLTKLIPSLKHIHTYIFKTYAHLYINQLYLSKLINND